MAVPLRGVAAEGELVGGVLRMRVRQRYENVERGPIEAIYTFPLPSDAAVVGFVMESGGRRAEAVRAGPRPRPPRAFGRSAPGNARDGERPDASIVRWSTPATAGSAGGPDDGARAVRGRAEGEVHPRLPRERARLRRRSGRTA